MKKITGYRNFGLLIGLVILLVLAAIITPAMYSYSSIMAMLRNNAVYGLLAVGMMFVIITGGIDISVGAILSLAGVISSFMMSENMEVPTIVWILVGIGVGVLCGLFNGVLIGKLGMVPMIATLGTMYIFRGLSYLYSQGSWLFPHQFTDGFINVSSGRTFGVYNIVWIEVLVLIIAGIFLGYTSAGRRVYAVGTNLESSKIAGIKTENVKVMAYAICGGMAGLAGVLYTGNYAMTTYSIGEGYEMTAIAICILGGVSINGGIGNIDGVIIGILLMSIITYFISLLPGLSVWTDAIQGAIIIIAVLINMAMINSNRKRALKERSELI